MKIKIINNGFEAQHELLKRCIEERIPVTYEDDGMKIVLCINVSIESEESYCITQSDCAWIIEGSDELGLYHGIGKFLHSATWNEEGFEPVATNIVVTPACSFRAAYFSVHFYNWYHMAPIDELKKYLEDMVLWGYNTVFCILPVVNFDNFDDPTYHDLRNKTRMIYSLAKKIGMKVGTIINPNQGLKTTPDELLADPSCYENRTGGGGKNVCPSKEGAMEYLVPLWKQIFEQYTDIGLDYVMTWPYDEGGCGCEKCRPWGGNGYLNMVNAVHEESVKYYPDAKFIVSTWYFDADYECVHEQGEYVGLYKRLKEDLQFVDYLMVDSHLNFPRYVLDNELIKPVVNFPEISMYGVASWGGRGANPLPKRFQRLWDSAKHVLSGGMPYSEGMYEDISKVQCVGYYWNPEGHYRDILGEYIRYEYDKDVTEEVLEIMECIEENHVLVRSGFEPNHEVAARAVKIAEAVDMRLGERAKNAWRWRILYIRTKLDKAAYDYYEDKEKGQENALCDLRKTRERYLADNDEAQDLMQELCYWYHTIDKFEWNKWTFPPVKGGRVLPHDEIKAVIFDCDGTLLDTERIFVESWKCVNEEMNLQLSEEIFMKTRGLATEQAKEIYIEAMGEERFHEVYDRRCEIVEEIFTTTDNLIRPGVRNLLRWLKAQGIETAVASAKTERMTKEHLEDVGLAKFFDAILGADMVTEGKPNPELFLKAAECIQVEPKHILVVGDSKADVGAAKNAGMRMVFVPNLKEADEEIRMNSMRVLRQIDEMIPIIEKSREIHKRRR